MTTETVTTPNTHHEEVFTELQFKSHLQQQNWQLDAVRAQINHDHEKWLTHAIDCIAQANDPIEELLLHSVIVKRRFSAPITINNGLFDHCQVDEIIRILLIKSALLNPLCHSTKSIASLIKRYYQAGDPAEKIALLKGLNWLDWAGHALDCAINASRCNHLNEFCALALNNPYPSQYFSELNFNQLVLKSLFMGLDIGQIKSLTSRLNSKLSNMCFLYAIEQALGERTPPPSLWLAIRIADLTDENRVQLPHYLKHFYDQDIAHQQQITQLNLL